MLLFSSPILHYITILHYTIYYTILHLYCNPEGKLYITLIFTNSSHVSSQSSCSAVSDSLWPCGLQHPSLLCPPLFPGVGSDSCPLSQWCYLTISSSAARFFCLQSFPASLMVSNESALCVKWPKYWSFSSVLPMNIQGWFPLGLTGLISLLSKGLPRVFSSTTVWKHQFFGTQSSLRSNSHIHTWPLGKP